MSDQRYLVTARKYRPNLFHEVVAQEHVTETLKNALRLDRLAHAYLFSGPRGVGKTTAARILAKAINCTTALEERLDQAEPCRTCTSCQTFEEGRNLNIFEIDAASNNKVEDIRDLRETVRIPPQGNRKKVYIIDEVHMLSNAAFNALLKTLEEPPPHVLFIFATTEPHKVLPTILSRCQRFDFRRIPVPEIIARLQEICAEEDITADEASLMLLARKGDGALRDALSAFDQALSLCGAHLNYPDLAEALRVVDIDLFFEVTQGVLDGNSAGMLRLVDRVVHAGYDLQEFLSGLAAHVRNLLVALTLGDTTLIEEAEATRNRYAETSPAFAEATLLRLLMIVDATEESIKSSTQPRLKVELALLKMASLSHTADLRTALEKLEALEAMIPAALPAVDLPAAEPASPTSRTPLPDPSADPLPIIPAKETSAPLQPRPETPEQKTPVPPVPISTEGSPPTPALPTPEETDGPEDLEHTDPPPYGKETETDVPEEAAASITHSREAPQPAPPEPPNPSPHPSLFGPPVLKRKQTPRTHPGPEPETEALFAGSNALKATHMVETAPAAPSTALDRVETVWPRYVTSVKKERIHVGALLQHTRPLDMRADEVLIGVPDDFHRRLLDNQREFLLKHLRDLSSGEVAALMFTVREDVQAPAVDDTPPTVDPAEYLQQKRRENPVIQALFEQFGGELVW